MEIFCSYHVCPNYLYFTLIYLCVYFTSEGRSSNVWESPKGCLLFSFSIQMEDGRVVPHIQYVVCLAMTEAIKAVCLEKVSTYIRKMFTGATSWNWNWNGKVMYGKSKKEISVILYRHCINNELKFSHMSL